MDAMAGLTLIVVGFAGFLYFWERLIVLGGRVYEQARQDRIAAEARRQEEWERSRRESDERLRDLKERQARLDQQAQERRERQEASDRRRKLIQKLADQAEEVLERKLRAAELKRRAREDDWN